MKRIPQLWIALFTAGLLWGCGDDNETQTETTTMTPTGTESVEPGETLPGDDTVMPTDPAGVPGMDGMEMPAESEEEETTTPGTGSDVTGEADPMVPADPSNPDAYEIYAFESRFMEGESSVSYTGQSARHALIKALYNEIDGLTDAVDSNAALTVEDGVTSLLNIYYRCPADVCEDEDTGISNARQTTVGEISGGKNLTDKIAGNDATGQHGNFNGLDADEDEVIDVGSIDFVGWTVDADGNSNFTPEGLVDAWIAMLDAAAVNRGATPSIVPNDPAGNAITKIYVTEEGHDLKQLIQKFLLGAVAFSQGTDDYLDYDLDGKGLNSPNDEAVVKNGDTKPYSALEHGWDEGFGYFGAARDYLGYTDDEIAGKGGRDDWQGSHDSDGDGHLDLSAEYNWGHAINAAKRDRGHSTDFTAEAFGAFLAGRDLIAENPVLSPEQLETLQGHSDAARTAWEKAIAATCIHYINDVISDLSATTDGVDNDEDETSDEADEYNFYDHAKHWSELKGFALSLQFSPISPVSGADFAELHDILGTAPTLPNTADFDLATRKTNLERARTILGTAYGFSEMDVTTW